MMCHFVIAGINNFQMSADRKMDFDVVWDSVGAFGRFQILYTLFWSICGILTGMQNLSYVFIRQTPLHRCFIVGCDDESTSYFLPDSYLSNNTFKETIYRSQCYTYQNVTHFESNTSRVNSQCSSLTFHNLTKPCTNWKYDRSIYQETVTTKWNLVCDSVYWLPLSGSLLLFGSTFGGAIAGVVSERFGRKPTVMLCMALQTIIGITASFVPYYELFLFLRFVVGACAIGSYQLAIVFVVETVGNSYRHATGAIACAAFAVGEVLLGVVAYFIRDWRILLWVISSPCPIWLLFASFTVESPRWLFLKKQYSKTKATLQHIAKWNRKEFPHQLWLQIEKNMQQIPVNSQTEKKTGMSSFVKIFSYPGPCLLLMITLILWFVVNLSYYGIGMNLPPLSTDEYISFILVSLFEIPSYVFMFFTANIFGRTLTLIFSLLLAGIMTLWAAFSPPNSVYMLVLILLGKFGVSTAYGVILTITSELFPTVVRDYCFGFCVMAGHIAAILAPYLSTLAMYYSSLPLVVFGVTSLFSGCLVIYIPETMDQPLLESLEDSEIFIKKNRFDVKKMWKLLLRIEETRL